MNPEMCLRNGRMGFFLRSGQTGQPIFSENDNAWPRSYTYD